MDYNTNEVAGVDVKVVVDAGEADGANGVEIDVEAVGEDEMYLVEMENGNESKTSLNGEQEHVEVGGLIANDSANESEGEVGVEIENAKEGGDYRRHEVAEAEEGGVGADVVDDADSHSHSY